MIVDLPETTTGEETSSSTVPSGSTRIRPTRPWVSRAMTAASPSQRTNGLPPARETELRSRWEVSPVREPSASRRHRVWTVG